MHRSRSRHTHDEPGHHHWVEVEHHGEVVAAYGKNAAARNFQEKLLRESGCVHVEPLASEITDAAAAPFTKRDEIVKIVESGDPSNRIDIVFMGDGYTAAERDRHFEDMERLTNDMFSSTTFTSHLPLFNIWAIFRESAESGIGDHGQPRDTAFGLYRDGTELRGVYCSKPMAARQACAQTGTDACDYPSLIGNDEFYGGLGGEFTISTRSLTSGTIVLRHELGHNLIDVGEEYDGGSVYSGVNSSPNLNNIKWEHWLSYEPPAVAEDANIMVQAYPWYDLAEGPYVINFQSDGYERSLLKFSASGCETEGSLIVRLDGVELPWNTTSLLDRGFHEFMFNTPLSIGSHQLVFEQGFPPEQNVIRQLCNVVMHEYRNESAFHFDREWISAYPTWRQGGSLAGYRPNNEKCLMRNMTSTDFCSPCIEGMWLHLLNMMSLIDDVDVTTSGSNVAVTLSVVPLAHFRPAGPREGEEYVVEWRQNGNVRSDLANQFNFNGTQASLAGSWSVYVKYINPEIRVDNIGATEATETFTI